MNPPTDPLSSWKDGPSKESIVAFVERVSGEDGSAAVPVEERVAVFDNDGTLWCEKPMPIQLDFIVCRLAEIAEAHLREIQRRPEEMRATAGPSSAVQRTLSGGP